MSSGSQFEQAGSRVAALCSLGAGAIALLALLSWVSGNWKLGTLGTAYVPMAPVTGWMLILLSGGLVAHSRWPASRAARRCAFGALASLAALGLLVWAPRIGGLQTSVERWLAPTAYTVEDVPVGIMSPLTGLTISLATLAFLLELQPFSRLRLSRWAAPALALAALLVSAAVLLSYLVALPLLYGSGAIPMALPTAAALFLLSCGLLTAAVREQQTAEHGLNAELEQRVKDRTVQLEASNRELEAFCYSVSHDLRAPLRGIDGWSLALWEDCRDKFDEKGRQHLQRVRADTQRMGQLIDDLLMLSRVTRGQIQRTQVDLSAIAQDVAARLEEAEPERRVEFTAQPGVTAQGDARLLEIVLSNLLGNSWKFSRARPLARVEFGRTERQGRPAYYVRDNGVGFDMTYSQKLFGAFQRMHKASEFPGTGIGLATVQRIIHRHGGRVWAEAQVDRGATFYFTLEEAA